MHKIKPHCQYSQILNTPLYLVCNVKLISSERRQNVNNLLFTCIFSDRKFAGGFQCKDGSFILNHYKCDGIFHCQDQSDEKECGSSCPEYLAHIPKTCACTQIDMNSECITLHVWYADINALYFSSTKADIIVEVMDGELYSNGCAQGWSICSDRVGSNCFPNEKLCVFERDKYGSPLYCNNTEHLSLCYKELLEKLCPSMYQCKESYCIPISMVRTRLCLNP